MARSRTSAFADLMNLTARLPWWAGVVLALIAYIVLRGLAGQPVVPATGMRDVGAQVTGSLVHLFASIGQYVLPVVFLAGAGISVFRRRKRRGLYAAATEHGADAIQSMNWRDFELLTGEAFRRQGYTVQETGGGADGGVDLILQKDGQRYLVQCKHWKAWKVGVKVVRELYGVTIAEGAAGGFVVTFGAFTKEAQAFAYDKNIVLIDGAAVPRFLKPADARCSDPPLTLIDPGPNRIRPTRRDRHAGERVGIAIAAAFALVLGALWLLNLNAFSGPSPRPADAKLPGVPESVAIADPPSEPPAPAPTQTPAERKRALEFAFEAQYVPPEGCDDWATDARMVACANHHIRAKRAFMAIHRVD